MYRYYYDKHYVLKNLKEMKAEGDVFLCLSCKCSRNVIIKDIGDPEHCAYCGKQMTDKNKKLIGKLASGEVKYFNSKNELVSPDKLTAAEKSSLGNYFR